MRIAIAHTTPQLRALDRVETVTRRALVIRFSQSEIAALAAGGHVQTELAFISEARA